MADSKKRPGEPKSIDGYFVALAIDDEGDEGIVGMRTAEGWMPMMTSTRSGLKLMREQAAMMADRSGETIRIVRFGRGRIVAEFTPRGKGKGGDGG